MWIDHQEIANKPTDQQGILDLAVTQAKPEDVAVLATSPGPGRNQRARRVEHGLGGAQSARLHLHRPPGVSSGRHGALQDHRAQRNAKRLPDSAGPRSTAGIARSAHLSADLAADRDALRHGHGALGLHHSCRRQSRLLLPEHAVGRALRRGRALLRAGLQEA